MTDDDPMIQLLSRNMLESMDFDVIQASDGNEALKIFDSQDLDLILCDVMMPEVDGFEFCEKIRMSPRGRHVPIVMLTGLNDTESIEKAFNLGATDFCVKPINWELLPYKLNYILRASATFSALKISEERYSLAAHGANDGLWDWDLKEQKIYFSPRWKEMLGFRDDEIGCDPNEWLSRIHADDKSRVLAELEAHSSGKTEHFESEYRVMNSDGRYLWMMCRSLAVTDDSGLAYRMTGSQTDITKRKEAEEKLLFDAMHDSLTKLPNRALFLDRLAHCIEINSRKPDFNFAVLFLDLNRFKLVNDSLGHVVGDKLLIEFSARISEVIRPGDTLARFGGDEFAILCEDIDDVSTVTKLAGRTQKQLSKPVCLDEQEVVIDCSMGITLSGSGYTCPDDMLRDADAAMYRAKAKGSSGYEIFDPSMHEQALNELQTESDLRLALEYKEFCIHYQPIVEIQNNKISGFEALLRWNHPQRGLLFPDDFIDVAISSKLIVPIGRWVLKEACNQLSVWKREIADAKNWEISINLSSIELSQPDLITAVSRTLCESALLPESLKLEITESSIIENNDHALKTMNSLNDLGVQLSIDDFGTGYSSFNYLHQFPFNSLKIDHTFIAEIHEKKDKNEIVKTIVALAHNLGMSVVAEGSESTEIFESLRNSRCEYAQGFGIAEPMPGVEVSKIFENNKLASS
ncbi:MAG: EAL domain-containing protein [Pseudomonadota bacterium]